MSGVDYYPDKPFWMLWEKMTREVGYLTGNLFDGGNFAIRRNLMEEMEGFKKNTIIDDIKFFMRLRRRGKFIKLVANPRAGATDSVYPTLKSFFYRSCENESWNVQAPQRRYFS